jgi:hypothetical protein
VRGGPRVIHDGATLALRSANSARAVRDEF